jgi:hypothetical protein
MHAAKNAEYEQVLNAVRSWSSAQQFLLVQELLKTLAPLESLPRTPRQTLDQARGLLTTGQAVPTDEEIAEWLDERRIERYGQ